MRRSVLLIIFIMYLVVLALLVAGCTARPQNNFRNNNQFSDNQFLDNQFSNGQSSDQAQSLEDAGIVRMENTHEEDGSFKYGFETVDPKMIQDVVGQIKQIGENVGVVMQGSYSYTALDEEGQERTYSVTWTADENGFRPVGDGIPELPPPVEAGSQQFDQDFF